MRTVSLVRVVGEARMRFGKDIRLSQLSLNVLREMTGCKIIGRGKIVSCDWKSFYPMPTAEFVWINLELIERRAEELHLRYYYEGPMCHLWRETLYCDCPQGA